MSDAALKEPLAPTAAKKVILSIIGSGSVLFSKHAREEMKKDGMTEVDVLNVLRGGVVESSEIEKGSWRYRVRTNRMYVVVAFWSETELVVVTGWRKK